MNAHDLLNIDNPELNVFAKEFREFLQDLSKRYPEAFPFKTPRKCMCNTELFMIASVILAYKPQQIFESGVWIGRSTVFLSELARRYLPECKVVVASSTKRPELLTFDPYCDNLKILYGYGEDEVKNITKGVRTFAVVDGPKMGKKYHLCKSMFDWMHENTELVGISQHDFSEKVYRLKPRIYRNDINSQKDAKFDYIFSTHKFLRHFGEEHRLDGKTFDKHLCIIFRLDESLYLNRRNKDGVSKESTDAENG